MDSSVDSPPSQSKAVSGGFPDVSLVTFLHLSFLFVPIRLDVLQLLMSWDKVASVLLLLREEAREQLDSSELSQTC